VLAGLGFTAVYDSVYAKTKFNNENGYSVTITIDNNNNRV